MTNVKANYNTAFSTMRDPIDRRPLHIGIVLLVGGQAKRMAWQDCSRCGLWGSSMWMGWSGST